MIAYERGNRENTCTLTLLRHCSYYVGNSIPYDIRFRKTGAVVIWVCYTSILLRVNDLLESGLHY